MEKVEFYLLGSPKIFENGKEIIMPIGKLSGILFYIATKKFATRDELSGIFWPSSNENRAKTSLRNALYRIKSYFKSDIFSTPNKSIITLNENVEFFIDVQEFLNNVSENLNLYSGDFLNGFFIKNASEFEYWVTEERAFLRGIFISEAEKNILKNFCEKKLNNFEKDIFKLINIDSFNETAYLNLMKYYEKIGRSDKTINIYYKYKNLIEEELGISPSSEIEKLKNEALKNLSSKDNPEKKSKLYKREMELSILNENLENFSKDLEYKSVLLSGEYGIGKTSLKNAFLENLNQKFKIYEIRCFSIEKDFSYSPWIKLINLWKKELSKDLSDNFLNSMKMYSLNSFEPYPQIFENREKFNTDLMHNMLLNLIEKFEGEKVIIIFEDIQNADNMSVKLLINLILHLEKNVMFFVTNTDFSIDSKKSGFTSLIDLDKILNIKLNRFSKAEVSEILEKELSDKKISEKKIGEIYSKSKGNSFFLNEYINLYKKEESESILLKKVGVILKEKFQDLNEDEWRILNILSAVYAETDLDFLMKISDLKPFDFLKSIDSLEKMNLVSEKKIENEIYIEFVYGAYKEYVYNQLNEVKKQVIHREIANLIEKDLNYKNDEIGTYIKLKNHFEKGNDQVKALKYEVYILNYYLYFNHEVFPDLSNYNLSEQQNFYLNNENALKMIDKTERKLLSIIDSKNQSEEIAKINLKFLACKGRYLIRYGNYKDGVRVLNKVIKISKDFEDIEMELIGHKQMLVYAIQLNDKSVMHEHVTEGIKCAKKLGNDQELGILYRLYGLYYLMLGDFKSAEKLFNQAIELLENSEKNPVSIAAIYNYIGEIRTAEFKYDKAVEYFNMAIELCKGMEATCLSIFYINAGQTSLYMEDIQNMKKYFLKAEKIIKRFDSYWKSSMLNAFLALIAFMDKDYEKSKKYLHSANLDVKTINDPRDIGMIYFIESLIKSKIEKFESVDYKDLPQFLNYSSEFYYYNAVEHLDSMRDRAAISYLKKNIISKNFNV